ncbi:MAG: hypothetical protein CBC22_03745 [Alphaproteobacteria bacterium TMED62]|nr:MAG: hypothetical protein CBC22_03745 [Alphaproteobacteria bacterium TMED62]|tara:strand:- start:1001 stop:1186 length:186 start_codon:yes stop_codon:yes gene_type:complete
MFYHPLMGISIFLLAIIISFVLGRLYIKKKSNIHNSDKDKKQKNIPQGEITSPDAPWLDEK